VVTLTGAQIFLRALEEQGVRILFGFPGASVLDIYDELGKSAIRHILVRHEQGAVHAADGYARASGSVGVCLVTSGPGATNTVTGIASAHMDSIPIVVFTGQVPTALLGNDAFQEVDIVGITRSCTKHNYIVRRVQDLARVIREAFFLARSGRPGPVLVDLPKDVLAGTGSWEPLAGPPSVKSYRPVYDPNPRQLHKVMEWLRGCERPMILAGGGVILSGASEQLTRFARRLSIPVATTLMGLGGFPGSDPLSLGMIGMHGTYRANMSAGHCDVLIAAGVRFDDRVTGRVGSFAPRADIVHIDIDPSSIRKTIDVALPVVGDCRKTFEKLNELAHAQPLGPLADPWSGWRALIELWKEAGRLCYEQEETIKPQYVVERLHALTGGEALITTEVGQNQMWAAQYYLFDRPNRFITSGGLGCMGFGLPAAIGAQVAWPGQLVVDIAGDGSIQMNIQELATAVQHGLPVKVVILNNRCLGMVRQWQELFYGKRYSHTCMENAPDFVKLAEAYGALGLRAVTPREVDAVLEEGLGSARTVVMDFAVDGHEKVYPMVPAGAPITDMLLV